MRFHRKFLIGSSVDHWSYLIKKQLSFDPFGKSIRLDLNHTKTHPTNSHLQRTYRNCLFQIKGPGIKTSPSFVTPREYRFIRKVFHGLSVFKLLLFSTLIWCSWRKLLKRWTISSHDDSTSGDSIEWGSDIINVYSTLQIYLTQCRVLNGT